MTWEMHFIFFCLYCFTLCQPVQWYKKNNALYYYWYKYTPENNPTQFQKRWYKSIKVRIKANLSRWTCDSIVIVEMLDLSNPKWNISLNEYHLLYWSHTFFFQFIMQQILQILLAKAKASKAILKARPKKNSVRQAGSRWTLVNYCVMSGTCF